MNKINFKSLMAETQIIGFALVGFVSTIIDFAFLKLFVVLGIGVLIATALSFCISSINGYLMNSYFVFNKKKTSSGYIKYFTVAAFGLLWTEILMYLIHVRFGLLGIFATKVITVIIVFFWNYNVSRKWAFK